MKYKYINKNNTSPKRRYGLYVAFALAVIILYIVLYPSSSNEVNEAEICNGRDTQDNICYNLKDNHNVGSLCMDLCIEKKFSVPDCSRITIGPNRYYDIGDDSILMSGFNDTYIQKLDERISESDFKNKLVNHIMKKLNHTVTAEKIADRLIDFVDVNRDLKINYAEAKTLWELLSYKNTFYMLTFGEKSYIPTIKSFCGNFLELEQIKGQVSLSSDSFFSNTFSWFTLNWISRCKISLGILEFYIDAISYNPNDEFGLDSLYLCSPIENSFGYTLAYEAKLINYDKLYSGGELMKKLSDRYCKSDLDCVYNNQCSTRCDTETNKCTFYLSKPQIVTYCEFLNKFLNDNSNVTQVLGSLIEECLNMKTLIEKKSLVYDKNEMPISFEKHRVYMAKSEYWKNSMEFATFINKLHMTLWDWIKFSQDPVKSTKKTYTKEN